MDKKTQNELDDKLLLGCTTGNITEVKEAIRCGANIHMHGVNPLFRACHNGHLPIVKLLVRKGANIHASNDYAGNICCEYGRVDIMDFLIKKGLIIHPGLLEIAFDKCHFAMDSHLLDQVLTGRLKYGVSNATDVSDSEDSELDTDESKGTSTCVVDGVTIEISPHVREYLNKKIRKAKK